MYASEVYDTKAYLLEINVGGVETRTEDLVDVSAWVLLTELLMIRLYSIKYLSRGCRWGVVPTYLSSSLKLIFLAKHLSNESCSSGLVAYDDFNVVVGKDQRSGCCKELWKVLLDRSACNFCSGCRGELTACPTAKVMIDLMKSILMFVESDGKKIYLIGEGLYCSKRRDDEVVAMSRGLEGGKARDPATENLYLSRVRRRSQCKVKWGLLAIGDFTLELLVCRQLFDIVLCWSEVFTTLLAATPWHQSLYRQVIGRRNKSRPLCKEQNLCRQSVLALNTSREAALRANTITLFHPLYESSFPRAAGAMVP